MGCKLRHTRHTNAILNPSLFKKWVALPISMGKCGTCRITKCKTSSGIGSRIPLVGWQNHQNPRSNLIKPASSWPYLDELQYQHQRPSWGGYSTPTKKPQILGNSQCPLKPLAPRLQSQKHDSVTCSIDTVTNSGWWFHPL